MDVKSPKFHYSVRKPLDHRAFKCRLLSPRSLVSVGVGWEPKNVLFK